MRFLLPALLALGLFVPPAAAEQPAADRPACIGVSAFARYGAYGYDHLVTIDNACDKAAGCVVTTNVNPDPIAVRVESGTRETVVTYRGSPASEFAARVRCLLEK